MFLAFYMEPLSENGQFHASEVFIVTQGISCINQNNDIISSSQDIAICTENIFGAVQGHPVQKWHISWYWVVHSDPHDKLHLSEWWISKAVAQPEPVVQKMYLVPYTEPLWQNGCFYDLQLCILTQGICCIKQSEDILSSSWDIATCTEHTDWCRTRSTNAKMTLWVF